MSEPLEIVKTVAPRAARAWAEAAKAHIEAENETRALIRDLQARIHRLEEIVGAYGLQLNQGE
jgi:hypothetical protein